MREIEYRYYDADTDKIYYVAMLDMWGDPDQWKADLVDDEDNQLFDIEIDKDNLMQFTGQVDSRGKKIWEGDAVAYPDARVTEAGDHIEITSYGVVKYCEETMSFYFTERVTVEMADIDISGEVRVLGFKSEGKLKELGFKI